MAGKTRDDVRELLHRKEASGEDQGGSTAERTPNKPKTNYNKCMMARGVS